MRITGMVFEKKIVTAQYEHELLRVECAVTESDDANQSLKELVKFVTDRGTVLGSVGDTPTSVKQETAPVAPPKSTKKAAAAAKETPAKEEKAINISKIILK